MRIGNKHCQTSRNNSFDSIIRKISEKSFSFPVTIRVLSKGTNTYFRCPEITTMFRIRDTNSVYAKNLGKIETIIIDKVREKDLLGFFQSIKTNSKIRTDIGGITISFKEGAAQLIDESKSEPIVPLLEKELFKIIDTPNEKFDPYALLKSFRYTERWQLDNLVKKISSFGDKSQIWKIVGEIILYSKNNQVENLLPNFRYFIEQLLLDPENKIGEIEEFLNEKPKSVLKKPVKVSPKGEPQYNKPEKLDSFLSKFSNLDKLLERSYKGDYIREFKDVVEQFIGSARKQKAFKPGEAQKILNLFVDKFFDIAGTVTKSEIPEVAKSLLPLFPKLQKAWPLLGINEEKSSAINARLAEWSSPKSSTRERKKEEQYRSYSYW